MTDRLSALLHEEATTLDIPAAAPERVLAQGRGVQRRRRTTTAVAGAVAAVLVAAVALTAVTSWRGDDRLEPAGPSDQTAYEELGAWAAGGVVHVGNHTAAIDGVSALLYTSVGVVVTDQDGYTLVTPEGDVEPLDLDLPSGGLGRPDIATDAGTPNLAYVRAVGDSRVQAAVRDLSTGEETLVGDPFRSRNPAGVDWFSGDLLSYAHNNSSRVVDWRTGQPATRPDHGVWLSAGVAVNYEFGGTWSVYSFDNELLLTVADLDPASSYGTLSPDGRYFAVSDSTREMTVYDVATGSSTAFDDRVASGYGWTPDGHLVGRHRAEQPEVEICDPATGECAGTDVDADGEVTFVVGLPGASVR